MEFPAESVLPAPAAIPSVPGWALPRGPIADPFEAAYMAGAALNALDHLVRSEPVWAGAWRQRLALKAAGAAARLCGYREDEAALRDAWHVRPPETDPGPAGHLLAARRRLCARSPVLGADEVASLIHLLGLGRSEIFRTLPAIIDEAIAAGRPAPLMVIALFRTH